MQELIDKFRYCQYTERNFFIAFNERWSKMNSGNKSAKLLGATFLIVAIATLLSDFVLRSLLGSGSISDSLVNIANNTVTMRIVILLDLITAIGIVVLAVLLFVILQKQNKTIALVALGWWLGESVVLAVSKISTFSLLSLSQEYVEAGAPGSSHFQTLGILFRDATTWGYTTVLLFFAIGGILFYYLFYKSRVVPWGLSVWAIIAVWLALIGCLLKIFDVDFGYIFIPNIAFELVIGVWLIIKGIRPYEVES